MQLVRTLRYFPILLALMVLVSAPGAYARQAAQQTRAGSSIELRGRISDPSGAVIAHATVTVIAARGVIRQAVTGKTGEFDLHDLPPGPARLTVIAPGFAPYMDRNLIIGAAPAPLAIRLAIGTRQQQVVVRGESSAVSLEPADRASAVIIRGQALKGLSDDPDQLQTDLQALAGPSVGAGGGSISIDGFTRGDIPPKSAIREIRVNENPFSARFQHLGYGRIEILTKPGSDTFHGHVFFDGNSAQLNALNPFLVGSTPPAYHSTFLNADAGGPLGKKISWFADIERRNINEVSIVNTEILSPSFSPQSYVTSVPNPRVRTAFAPRIDIQLTPNNTLTARYEFLVRSASGNGVGSQSLPSQAYDYGSHHHNLQVSDTEIVSPTVINRLRYQYLHFHNHNNPVSTAPALDVLGAFTGGGNSQGASERSETHNAARDDVSMTDGRHQIEFGGYVRDINRTESSTGNFNGTFVFNSLSDYQKTELALQQGQTMDQIQAAGYGPSQFSITMGQPLAHVNRVDAALYLQDTWKVLNNLQASYGLRFETENRIHDHSDFAPRLGIAWGLGHGNTPKTVLRAGAGVFFNRLDDDQMIVVDRLNGINQQQFLVGSPDFFPTIPAAGSFTAQSSTFPTVYQLAPNLQSPYMVEAGVGIERQFGQHASLSVNYLHSSGNDQFLTNDVNAPLPGTYVPGDPSSGNRPLGAAAGNIYQYQSAGIFRQNQLIANFKLHGSRLSLFGYYTLNDAHSDTAGVNSFPADPWDLMANYGRAPYDIRHRVFLGGSINLPWHITASPFLVAHSGVPFSLTLGQDLYGAGQQNARPGIPGPSTPAANLKQTPWGTFDLHPVPGEAIVAPNTATGPGAFALNLRLRKTFSFGGPAASAASGSKGNSEQRYRFTVGVAARNIFNNVNLAAPVGNLNSPLFGHSITLAGGPFSAGAANRRIDLQASFEF